MVSALTAANGSERERTTAGKPTGITESLSMDCHWMNPRSSNKDWIALLCMGTHVKLHNGYKTNISINDTEVADYINAQISQIA